MTEDLHVFAASRLTSGNRIFPTRIEITPTRVSRVKPRLAGRDEESIPMAKVASVSIKAGLLFAAIRIDSSGGTVPITSEGHTRGDAYRIRDLIQGFQKEAGRDD